MCRATVQHKRRRAEYSRSYLGKCGIYGESHVVKSQCVDVAWSAEKAQRKVSEDGFQYYLIDEIEPVLDYLIRIFGVSRCSKLIFWQRKMDFSFVEVFAFTLNSCFILTIVVSGWMIRSHHSQVCRTTWISCFPFIFSQSFRKEWKHSKDLLSYQSTRNFEMLLVMQTSTYFPNFSRQNSVYKWKLTPVAMSICTERCSVSHVTSLFSRGQIIALLIIDTPFRCSFRVAWVISVSRFNAVSQRPNLKEVISEHYSNVYATYAKELEDMQEVSEICVCSLCIFRLFCILYLQRVKCFQGGVRQ